MAFLLSIQCLKVYRHIASLSFGIPSKPNKLCFHPTQLWHHPTSYDATSPHPAMTSLTVRSSRRCSSTEWLDIKTLGFEEISWVTSCRRSDPFPALTYSTLRHRTTGSNRSNIDNCKIFNKLYLEINTLKSM